MYDSRVGVWGVWQRSYIKMTGNGGNEGDKGEMIVFICFSLTRNNFFSYNKVIQKLPRRDVCLIFFSLTRNIFSGRLLQQSQTEVAAEMCLCLFTLVSRVIVLPATLLQQSPTEVDAKRPV